MFDSFLRKLKRVFFLLKHKGLKYTYNYLHLYFFYGTRNPLTIKFLHWWQPYPPYLEVEITTRCNLKCVICERTYWKEENRDMTYEQFVKIMKEFPKLKWIGLTGIGESFLNPDYMKMLKYVKDKGIYVELYDNFYFLDESMARQMVQMGIDKIFISLDAATKETYEKLRVGSNFEKVTKNVANLIKIREEMKKPFPEVAFHCILNKLNVNEAPQYVELCAKLSQGQPTTVQFTRLLHKFKEISGLFVEIPEHIIEETEKRAKELGVRVTWNRDVSKIKPPVSCCTAWLMPFIFATGHVIPCCTGNEAGRRDFQKAGALGNIFEQNFNDIWNGEKYKKLRKALRENRVPPQCHDCSAFDTGEMKMSN